MLTHALEEAIGPSPQECGLFDGDDDHAVVAIARYTAEPTCSQVTEKASCRRVIGPDTYLRLQLPESAQWRCSPKKADSAPWFNFFSGEIGHQPIGDDRVRILYLNEKLRMREGL